MPAINCDCSLCQIEREMKGLAQRKAESDFFNRERQDELARLREETNILDTQRAELVRERDRLERDRDEARQDANYWRELDRQKTATIAAEDAALSEAWAERDRLREENTRLREALDQMRKDWDANLGYPE